MSKCFFCRTGIEEGIRCGDCVERTVGFAYGVGLVNDRRHFGNLKKLQKQHANPPR